MNFARAVLMVILEVFYTRKESHGKDKVKAKAIEQSLPLKLMIKLFLFMVLQKMI